MKKLVVLVVILLMTSVASADLVLSVNGSTSVTEITVTPSTYVEIDVQVDEGYNQSYDLDLILSNNQAVWVEPVWYDPPGLPPGYWENIEFPTSYTQAPSTVASSSSSVIRIMGVMNTAEGDYAGAGDVIMKLLKLHCEEATDVTLTLVVHDDAGMLHYETDGVTEIEYSDGQVLDTVTIHQVIPEPATLALLGLGGLLLRRRR
jgi:hypothetical protein